MKYGCETGSTSVSAAALCINRLSLAPGGLPCALNSVSPPPPFVCGFGVPFSSDSCLSGGFGWLGDSLFMPAHLVRNLPYRLPPAPSDTRPCPPPLKPRPPILHR